LQENIVEIQKNLEQINKLVRSKYREIAQECNLTLEQFHILIELHFHHGSMISEDILPLSIGEIAEDIGKAPHTLSERIKRLEKKDLVKKVRDKKDLRITRVLLTHKGQALMNRIENESSNIFVYNALEKMDEKSLNKLLNGLKQLNKNLSSEIDH